MAKKKNNKKKVHVMIGSGANAFFMKVPKGTKITLHDGTIIKAGVNGKEFQKEMDKRMNKTLGVRQYSYRNK